MSRDAKRLYMRNYREKNREKRREQARAYWKRRQLRDPERVKELARIWKEKNREWVNERARKYRKDNLDRAREIGRNFERRHKEKRREKQLKYLAGPGKLANRLRCRIWEAIKLARGHRAIKTMALIGCTIPELRAHLEAKFKSGMTWENYGPVWHIDHVRPCASFNLADAEQQKICFHFSNLQPLFAVENICKGKKYAE